jgi:hypothetical protein
VGERITFGTGLPHRSGDTRPPAWAPVCGTRPGWHLTTRPYQDGDHRSFVPPALPERGDTLYAPVAAPFDGKVGGSHTFLFFPQAAEFHHWEQDPSDQLEQWGALDVRILGVSARRPDSAVLEVRVERAHRFMELDAKLPRASAEGLISWRTDGYPCELRWRDVAVYVWTAQGDVGEWLFVRERDGRPDVVLAAGEWGGGDAGASFVAGHGLLPEADVAHLMHGPGERPKGRGWPFRS